MWYSKERHNRNKRIVTRLGDTLKLKWRRSSHAHVILWVEDVDRARVAHEIEAYILEDNNKDQYTMALCDLLISKQLHHCKHGGCHFQPKGALKDLTSSRFVCPAEWLR